MARLLTASIADRTILSETRNVLGGKPIQTNSANNSDWKVRENVARAAAKPNLSFYELRCRILSIYRGCML